MTAPAGAVVSLYVDLVARVAVEDVIETQSGRRYRVLGVREQTRGKHVGRQHLSCLVLGADDPDATHRFDDTMGPRLHQIRWYPRPRKIT